MSALAERLSTEKALQKERREVEKDSILRKLTRQHPAGMSAYSLWVELFSRQGDVGHVAGLLEELAEAKLVSGSGGCWYAGAKVPASGIAPRAEPEPIVQLRELEPATVATAELGEEASAVGGGLLKPSPLWLSTRLVAALDAGHAAVRLGERTVELGGYPPDALRSITALISAIRTGRSRGTSSIYRPGIEAALSEIGFGRDYRHGSQPAQVAPCTEEEGDGVPCDRGEEPRRDPDQAGGGADGPRSADLGCQVDGSGGRPGAEAPRGGLPGERGGDPDRAADVPLEPAGREVEDGGREPGAAGLQREGLTARALAAGEALDAAARVIADARQIVPLLATIAREQERLRARVAELEQREREQEETIARLRGLRDAALRALSEGTDG